MKLKEPQAPSPLNANELKDIKPVICYNPETIKQTDDNIFSSYRENLQVISSIEVPNREARCFEVKAGQYFRIESIVGSQVGDLNLWHLNDLNEKFYTGKTRALHGTHLSTTDRLWSAFPYLRSMATITYDTLDWYGFDQYGGSVHDVIGTRCDPYTHSLLTDGDQYHYCCHSNLCRALSAYKGISLIEAEKYVHDVLNVFMCTGFDKITGQYFMKASPVRKGDYLEFFAEIDLLGSLSVCPGGDCSQEHSSDKSQCHPLGITIYKSPLIKCWKPSVPNQYQLQ